MSPVLAIALLVAVNVATVGAMLFVRHRAPEGSYFRDTQQAAGVFTVAGTAYAVLLAFVFLLAFQSYNSARSSAEQEATGVYSLYHDADPFAEPVRSQLHSELVCYGRSVIHLEWPEMADGNMSRVTQNWLDRLDATFGRTNPRTPKQQNADSNWTTLEVQRLEGRRGRLQEAKPLVPGLVWILLGIGSIVVVVFVGMFADRRERSWVQAMLMLSVTTIIVAGLLMIKFFDDPYTDVPGSIQPDAMRRILGTLAATPGEQRLRPPCDAAGRPIRSIA
jgi:Protein of unknown function (DUF4239)